MTERLADIGARITGVRQLGAVVNAMRGIAASRMQQARSQLEAVDSYAAIIEAAIGRVLALGAGTGAATAPSRPAIVVFCAEQGFAGGFSEHVLDALGADATGADLFLIGTQGAVAAAERGIASVWHHPMPSHSAGIPRLADSITEAILARIMRNHLRALEVVFMQNNAGQGTAIRRLRLLPLDAKAFHTTSATAPIFYLATTELLQDLTLDYLHAQLCRAALHGFAAENNTRMQSMAAARTQIDRQLDALQSTRRLVRQEEITAEIIELAAGETATNADAR